MILTQKRLHNYIQDSLKTLEHLCMIMNDLQLRLVGVDLSTLSLLEECESETIKYYDELLSIVYDEQNYLEKIGYNDYVKNFYRCYEDLKSHQAELKEKKYII